MTVPTTLRTAPSRWFVLAIALCLPTLATWLYFFQAHAASAGVQLAVYNGFKIIQFLLPIVWVIGVQKQRVFAWPEAPMRGVGRGIAFGLSVALTMAALYWALLREHPIMADASAPIREKLRGFGIETRIHYALLGLFYSLLHALLEEYYWRWFVFGELRQITSLGVAVGVSSLGFTAHHILVLGKFFGFASAATWVFSAAICIGGAAWALLYHASRSLVGPWLSHLLVDAAIFAIGYDVARDVLH